LEEPVCWLNDCERLRWRRILFGSHATCQECRTAPPSTRTHRKFHVVEEGGCQESTWSGEGAASCCRSEKGRSIAPPPPVSIVRCSSCSSSSSSSSNSRSSSRAAAAPRPYQASALQRGAQHEAHAWGCGAPSTKHTHGGVEPHTPSNVPLPPPTTPGIGVPARHARTGGRAENETHAKGVGGDTPGA
jgi:hypothetical protein